MTAWNHIPMVRLIIPFAGGILTFISSHPSFLLPCGIIWILFGINALLLLFGYRFISYKRRWLIGAFLQALLFSLGFQLAAMKDKSSSGMHFRNMAGEKATLVAKVKESLAQGQNSHKTILECIFMVDSGNLSRCHGLMLAYFQKDRHSGDLKYGDVIMLNEGWQVIQGPYLPGAFNYQQYMRYRRVYDQVYLSSTSWHKTGTNLGNPVIAFSLFLQQKILNSLKANGLEGDELAIAGAILAGHREALDQETRQAFSGAGAMHILCVSGLHVGVIYIVLSSVLGLLLKNKRTRILKFILLISSIWLYALVTGCSPSVLRASTMISFIVLGRLLKSNTNIYNTLAASAFLLLLVDPMMIMSIGFQLSYMAVLGIVTVQPALYKLIFVKYWIVDKAWAIVTVSIAAQAGTFPLAIYYFHQFPTFFILTNLIVIPASSLIIYLGFIILLTAPIAWLSSALGWVLSTIIHSMDEVIFWINELPCSVAGELYTALVDTAVIYLLLMLISQFFNQKKKRLIWAILVLIIILSFSFAWRRYDRFNQGKFIVHATRNHQAYEFVVGSDHYLFIDSEDRPLLSEISFHASDYWIGRGLGPPRVLNANDLYKDTILDDQLCIYRGVVNFKGKRIFFPERDAFPGKCSLPAGLDFLVLSGTSEVNFKDPKEHYAPVWVVFDGTTDRWKVSTWKAACDSMDWAYHDVNAEGAFLCNLE